MKRIYINPESTIVKIDTRSFLAGSIPVPGGAGGTGDHGEAKEDAFTDEDAWSEDDM